MGIKINKQKSSNEELSQKLRENGIILGVDSFDYVLGHVKKGIKLAKDYFNVSEDTGLGLGFNPDGWCFEYSPSLKRIYMPIPFLNHLSKYSIEQLGNYPIGVSLPIICKRYTFPLPKKLVGTGIHETIHHFQNIELPEVKSRHRPGIYPADFSSLKNLLSYCEVEARALTDKVLEANGYSPVWRDFDTALRTHFPTKYGIPLDRMKNGRTKTKNI